MVFFVFAAIFLADTIMDNAHWSLDGDPAQWHLYALGKLGQLLLWGCVCFYIAPRRNYLLLSFLACMIVARICDIVVYILAIANEELVNVYSAMIYTSGILVWVAWVMKTAEMVESDKLDEANIFLIAPRPVGLFQTIVSLFNRGRGVGYGVYAAGKFYHFRNEMVVSDDGKILERTKERWIIRKYRPLNADAIRSLDAIVGQRWTVCNNCTRFIRVIENARPGP